MFMAECKKAGFTNAQAEFMFEMYWRRYQGNKQECMKTLKQKRKEAIKSISSRTGSTSIHVCMADDMHPYNCDGVFGGDCIHCDGITEDGHDPDTCALCHWDEQD